MPGLSLKKPFDYYLFFNANNACVTVPIEGKFQDGGKTFSLKRWREGAQGHQFRNLLKYKSVGAYPVLVVLWKTSGIVRPKVMPVTVECQYVDTLNLEDARTVCDLIALKHLLKLAGD